MLHANLPGVREGFSTESNDLLVRLWRKEKKQLLLLLAFVREAKKHPCEAMSFLDPDFFFPSII